MSTFPLSETIEGLTLVIACNIKMKKEILSFKKKKGEIKIT